MPLLSAQPRLLPDAHHHRALLPPSAAASLLPSPSCSGIRSRRRPARTGLRVVSPETSSTVATDAATTAGAPPEPTRGRADKSKWAEFAARVSGEWDGFGADFTASGDPVELPENVVPEAYREWGVQVVDWQTQCPTLADPATPCALHYRLVRLLPTVGCEADAATVHTSHQRHAASAAAFAYAAAGSYVAAWPRGPAPVLEVEHCVVRPDAPAEEAGRVRVVQTVALGREARLRGVKVFAEQWYGPFRDGEQLGGCAVGETAFAAGEKLDVAEVIGQWETTDAAAARFSTELDPETGKFAELSPDEPRKVLRDAEGVVTLPKELWSAFKELGDGEFLCEVGWALGGGTAVTSRCVLSTDGDVKEIAAAHERRVTETT
ncbi:uncharacterized protein LOC8061441 isoform X1 [Sorghum bicolor]|uniref:DUF3598 domain-containing protein n=1 Tax=Sorghum bicolor TaxID=4558 RepID=A0A1B6QQR9_SORBI|nr:uncharacterized protein LOC8061441 isoform X1 [Sorghum bicolor]XP_021319112.1 uncharacterized protein LOC8061441 isoform X1 [Sorghum bicolor]XP_021319117.1 uncharacterized protein LOC8061441 isoform X1 [Sorghum bicolor]XP_021319123.1 uncharacterized protein LOC8061441 isoform X1 [Sorghum bicolor]XP_021319126.1 uncharacterized protein LOC8061441 isoform X1 [Sorghum bicolor]KXG40268.1 hypothetical protein SORBI_3001G520800 [Sorghum bicolor]OQU93322.1 hypothetical protein SORBI_3001G520800 [S|eukprot:XP_002465939.2 uncharacterized protein LOC8061441 isoform X1 [Sorghum bicolor]